MELPQYERAKLVVFRDVVESACGLGQSATGPFYCPADRKVYIDLGFYADLKRRFGAPGDLLGTEREVRQLQQSRPQQGHPLSVRMELQADCYAGIWGHTAAQRGRLDPGDVEEGLGAAAAIGDDRLTGGRVAPERFTHGSSGGSEAARSQQGRYRPARAGGAVSRPAHILLVDDETHLFHNQRALLIKGALPSGPTSS